MTPRVSVVILSYNRLADLRETVDYCRGYTYPDLEFLIVDNGSSDGSREYIESLEPVFGKILLDRNTGSARGHSEGMRAATGKYVITMDDDAFVEDTALSETVRLFEEHDSLAVISYNCINYYTEYEPGVVKTTNRAYSAQEIDECFDLFTESSAAFRKSALEEAGYHQDEYFYGGEDTELGMRILAAGHRILNAPNLVSYHKITNTHRDNTLLTYNSTRNTFWIILQYFPGIEAPKHLFRFLWYLSRACVMKRRLLYLKALVEGGLCMFTMLSRRKPLPRRVYDKILFPYRMVFLW